MRAIKKVIIILLVYSMIAACSDNKKHITTDNPPEETSVKITILYDNYPFASGVNTDWGFSCLIEGMGNPILFDAGARPDILLQNITILNKDMSQVELGIISHNHSDHIGGLTGILERNHNLTVYLPSTVSEDFCEVVRTSGAGVIQHYDSLQICPNVYLTGELVSQVAEQALILDTEKGLVVITGCAHPGIVRILRSAKAILNKEIYLVLGGFHLVNYADEEILNIINDFQDLGVQNCAPTHCSGDRTRTLFQEAYGENFIRAGAGKVISF